jgi:23S rRNA (cytosine1962-C5)-methyltransferase
VIELERAWSWREARGVLGALPAVRVFHGPGEGKGALAALAIDRFDGHYWVTDWSEGAKPETKDQVAAFLKSKSARSAVWLARPRAGLPEEPKVLLGQPPAERFEVREGEARYWIQTLGTRHPGLFLDHLPLRRWLSARMAGARVLNTFSYTGSLSVACGLGGAVQVTTLDLSRATVDWARANWELNGLANDRARFVAGDYFEWMPRLKREGKRFDCIILDPPSFSRGKKGGFSTARDLGKLHELALQILEPGGMLVTSINSAAVPRARFEAEVLAAFPKGKVPEVLLELGLPETFPTPLGDASARYLKGLVLRCH